MISSQQIQIVQERPEDFRLLERIPLTKVGLTLPHVVNEPVGDELSFVVLDTETTGLSADNDSIIELGMVQIKVSPSACRVSEVTSVVSMYEDPGKPIPPVITGLTGIGDETVAGHRIDEDKVRDLLGADPIVVAHNAGFDRPFVEKRLPGQPGVRWACSAKDIDWAEHGYESIKLEYLAYKCGYFYEGHRASVDCLAVVWLMIHKPEIIGELLAAVEATTVLVQAFGAPFDVKDTLKGNGYKWHDGLIGANKHWWKEVAEEDLGQEHEFLDETYRSGSERAHYRYITSRERYKQK